MEVKGANPFLFTEEESSPNSSNSNPFLMNEDDFSGDNPFLSQSAATMAPSHSTNPFAFDPMDMGPAEAQQMETSQFQDFDPSVQGFDQFNSTNIFSAQDFLSDANATIPQKPTDLDLKYTNSETLPPKPPKETQDLLMSVMGAMDATSTHLLDRIPPTRTPSPVSMRDLHSPSPTPEPFGDLLDVSDAKEDIKSSNDLLMLDHSESDDVNKNHTVPAKPVPPQRPGPPARPPRPALPPQKPPPPMFAQPNQVVKEIQPNVPPQKPPPPAVQKETTADDNMMFGETLPPKPVTTQDIMSLYNKPAEKQEIADLLCDAFDTTPESSLENVQNDKTPQPLVQDNFLSPDPSQSETQMDTSDSQSKGSASSVTFNPFAVQDVTVVSPVKTNDAIFQEDIPMEEFSTVPNEENKVQEDAAREEMPQQNIFASSPTLTQPTSHDIFQDQDPNVFQTHDNEAFNDQPMQPDQSARIDQKENIEIFQKQDDAFDAFTAKFESAAQDENKNGEFDAFGGSNTTWGDTTAPFNDTSSGFGPDESFDAFLAMQEPPAVPQSTPNKFNKSASLDSDEGKDFSVVIRPKNDDTFADAILPTIAPPPAVIATDSSPRFNPFDQSEQAQIAIQQEQAVPFGFSTKAHKNLQKSNIDDKVQLETAIPQDQTVPFEDAAFKRTDSQETPPTPLFDDDVSQPLEQFPRLEYFEDFWEIQLRQPNKKKITGQRFWRKMWLRVYQTSDTFYLQLFNSKDDKNPVQELPLQPCYSVSDVGAQQYDTFGKIFTVKIQYIFYKERPGIRPGQVKKAERITNKLSQFAAYAIQGDYQGVKEFGSDLKKLGLPVEHAPQVSQLMKLGSLSYEDLKRFSVCMEEALFKMNAHRDRALQFKMEEVQITAVDELYVEQDAEGHVEKQIARVRLFFLGFLTGMPDIELGINDMRRQGKEVVGRHDIIPVATEEWIRLEDVEFHSCVQQDEYEKSHIIRFQPPDACYIEVMRFRIRPPKNRELPLQLKPTICISGNKVELRADVLVPGFASRKLGQVPCEDVMIRFPIPECWIYLFRVEKHFRYGSVKSTHRRTGKVKGIERILGTVDTLQESLIEVTSGQAKYEHQHRAIVWRCPRLPKEGQGAYTTHNMVCRLALTSYDQMPEKLAEFCYVEFTMPATQVSHTTVRSVSLQNSDSDDPPEKYVRYLARHEYRVGIEHTEGTGPAAYEVATSVPKPAPATIPEQVADAAESSTDSD